MKSSLPHSWKLDYSRFSIHRCLGSVSFWTHLIAIIQGEYVQMRRPHRKTPHFLLIIDEQIVTSYIAAGVFLVIHAGRLTIVQRRELKLTSRLVEIIQQEIQIISDAIEELERQNEGNSKQNVTRGSYCGLQ